MRALIQRVSEANVSVSDVVLGRINKGYVILLGFADTDTEELIPKMIDKIVNLRVFEDMEGKMNLSLLDVSGEVLIVSKFTLYADTSKGRRPSFVEAARPEQAKLLYEEFVSQCRSTGLHVAKGEFQAHMQVRLVNDGPVTILLEV